MNGQGNVKKRWFAMVVTAGLLTAAPCAWAQEGAVKETIKTDPILQLNSSVESLVHRVSQSVVQVIVSSYGPVETGSQTQTDLVIGRQRSIGSGVVVDADGYIVTNAHVVNHARRVQVVLPGQAREHTVEATIAGTAPELDLALLKVNERELPALPMVSSDDVHQGELVFAFGSPEGLRETVTMGIVSAVARQPDADSPMVYVQTDAPINHGNSGGPLVNIRGELVGINTFIMSESGGSQGLGFAIPSALVQMAYPKLRRYGHLHRGELGMMLQTVTPTLAEGLRLSQDWGAMISDIVPGGPAENAGLKIKDIVVRIDSTPVDSLPALALQLLTRSAGDTTRLEVLRGSEHVSVNVSVSERPHDLDRLTDLVDPENGRVQRLGVLGIDAGGDNARLGLSTRDQSGVIVVAHMQDGADITNTGLQAGDTIHAVNDLGVASLADLRAAVDSLKAGSAVVLQIERSGQLMFLPFELDE